MTCISPPEIRDEVLLAFLDGEAESEVEDHLRDCEHCRTRSQTLARLQGVLTTRISASRAPMAGACVLQSSDAVVLVTDKGAAKTILARNAPRKGRATVGESIIALRKRDVVVDAFVPYPRVSTE